MKKLIALMALSYLLGCNSGKKDQADENFDWLLGNWVRTNEEAGRSTFENWKKENDSTFICHSFTMQAQDTVWQENTRFSTVNGAWYLQVKTHEDSVSTDFKVNAFGSDFFSCENPQNEFPKVISYRKEESKLLAEISNSDMKIEFIFEQKH